MSKNLSVCLSVCLLQGVPPQKMVKWFIYKLESDEKGSFYFPLGTPDLDSIFMLKSNF